jgi:hypothetical protein
MATHPTLAQRNPRAQKPALRLVPKYVCADTVELAKRLLELAQDGDVIGLTVGIALPNRLYCIETVGTLRDCPTFARGLIRAMDDELRELVHA